MTSIRTFIFDFDEKGRKLKTAVFCLLLLSVFCIPLSAEMQITKTVRLQFPLEVLVSVTALLTLVGFLLQAMKPKFGFIDFAVLFFLVGAGISAFFSLIPLVSSKAFVVLTAYALVFYFGFRFLNLKEQQWNLVWRVLMVSFTILMLYTLFRYFNLGIHRQHSYEMSLPFSPGHTLLVAVGFPAFLYALDRAFRRMDVKLNLAFVLLFTFVTAISYSRIYWVMLLASAFILTFYYFRRLRIPMVVASVILFIVAAGAYHQIKTTRDREGAWNSPDDHNTLFVQIESIFRWTSNESNLERSNRWKVAHIIFRDHPYTGTGLNTYPEVYFWYMPYAGIQETNLSCVKMNAHQVYRGWLADMGVIGFAAGLLLLCSFFGLVMQLRGSPHVVFAVLLFVNFIALGMIEDFTTLEKIMAVFWISVAYLCYLNFARKVSS